MFLSEGLQPLESIRFGMYKNFRVGLIKYFDKGVDGSPDYILVEVIEMCNGSNGIYFSAYNLHVEMDDKFSSGVGLSSVGKWILFGFYIQSFHDKSQQRFITTLKIRYYEELTGGDVTKIEINNSRIKNQEGIRYHLIPNDAYTQMIKITEQTKYNEYGKR